jgi:Tol biopolymer transport system component/DNA-binding winged helix-turn-helix (wHTH) protein
MAMSATTDSAAPAAATRWKIGNIVFDPAARSIAIDDRLERISKKASDVLLRLVEQPGQVVSRERLIAEVWNGNTYTGAQGLTYTISQLRRSIQQLLADIGQGDPRAAIETISKSGYRLLLPVMALPASGAAAAEQPVLLAAEASPRRARLLIAATLAVALSLLAALAALLLSHGAGRAVEPGALKSLTTLDGVEDNPSYSADGRYLAFAWKRAGAPALLRIVDTQQPDLPPRDIADPIGRVERPVWIDARRLAYLQAVHAESCRVIVVDLRDASRRDLGRCFYLKGAASLAASPDGQWLAFSRRAADDDASNLLMLQRIADGQERELSRSPAGFGYGNLAWSHDGRQLALLRLKDTVGDIWSIDIGSGKAAQLTRLSVPIWALGWSVDDRDLLFSAGLENDFAIWRLPAAGGTPRRFARLDNVTSLIAIPGSNGDIAASVVRFEDHIETYSTPDLSLRDSIRSSGRDLYADVCGDAQHPIFISFRSRAIGIWYRDGADAEPRQLSLPAGTPEPPVCSPDGKRYATILSPADGGRDRLLIAALEPGAQPRLIEDASALGSPSWSLDGRTLILSSDRGGRGELWRFDPLTQSFSVLTDDGAGFGREVDIGGTRWLFYNREGERGLWRRQLDASGVTQGAALPVLDDLAPQDWGNWQWYDGQLWSIGRDASGDQLLRRPLGGAAQRLLSLPKGSVGPYRSLAIDRHGQILLTRSGPTQADIVRVPDEDAR